MDEMQRKQLLKEIEKLINKEEYAEANKIFLQNEIEINSFQGKYLKAMTHYGLNDLSEADKIFTELYKSHPENLNVIYKLAELKEKLLDFKKSLEYLNQILFLDPFNSEINKKVKELIFEIIKNIPDERSCKCEEYIKEAII